MPIKIYYVSDLHLEYRNDDWNPEMFVPTDCTGDDILILAGDIGQYQPRSTGVIFSFLEWVTPKFAAVVYVPGNHEFWADTKPDVTNNALKRMCDTLGVHYLNQDFITVNSRICILGCTLWSYISPVMESTMSSYLRDNQNIPGWSPARARSEFLTSRNWLLTNIKRLSQQYPVIIVVTHHAPLVHATSKPEYEFDPKNCGYCSDCSDVVTLANYWVFGHTHHSTQIEYKGCKVLANQVGKPDEADTGFRFGSSFTC